jgi:hypothetical protein
MSIENRVRKTLEANPDANPAFVVEVVADILDSNPEAFLTAEELAEFVTRD